MKIEPAVWNEGKVRDTLAQLSVADLEAELRAVRLNDSVFDALCTVLRDSESVIFRYPAKQKEAKRDALFDMVMQLVSDERGADDEERIKEIRRTIEIAENGYREILSSLAKATISKLPPTRQLWAAVTRAAAELDQVRQTAVYKPGSTLGTSVQGQTSSGMLADVDGAAFIYSSFVIILIGMLARTNGWVKPDGRIMLPDMIAVDDADLAAAADKAKRRCAIYTRKSTEEGLDQAFNSLDAQREACAAYVMSQCHEGWELVPDLYDDGGYSGGNMERPGLRHLLDDVKAGRVDIIVVYKVDRLTRSLADFAKIVEVLDKQGASFVSVTQAFNTTNSMGRLTLNVLLSFAQFEREVTGERIRDKIAASKARGMWMGGSVPLGYEVKDRKLVVVPEEAERVRMIFERYLALGSVLVLAESLKAEGIRSKVRVSRSGKEYGNASFSRGALYLMLKNRIYLGEVMHKGKAYPGEHDAIIDTDLFNRVAALLRQNRNNHVNGVHAEEPSLLIGKVYDGLGRIMSPDHATKRGRRYRYYASRTEGSSKEAKAWRVPAGDLEGLVLSQLSRRFDPETMSTKILSLAGMAMSEQRALIASAVQRIDVHLDRVDISFANGEQTSVNAPIIRRGRETRLAISPDQQSHAQRDPALIKLVVKAHRARHAVETNNDRSIAELAEAQGYSRDYFGVLLRIAYLAPDIVAAILDGRQPVQLNRQRLARATNLPLDWQGQRAMLGFS